MKGNQLQKPDSQYRMQCERNEMCDMNEISEDERLGMKCHLLLMNCLL